MNMAVSTGRERGRRSLASWWRGRYGSQLLFEIALCGALLMIYRGIRTFNKSDLQQAFAHSREVIRLESWLGLPFEDNLQRWLLDHPTVIKFLNHYYIWLHFPAAIGLLLWLYLSHPRSYHPFRNLMAFITFAALVIHLAFPLAPPRMMAGFVDTMREFGPSIYPKNALDGAANQIAAMPSLHFGWAMIEAIAIISVLRTRWRFVALLHPILMTLSIIATANHWWIDAAAAAALILAAIALWRLVGRWIGDREWSWSAMRFRAVEQVHRVEHALAVRASGGERAGERADHQTRTTWAQAASSEATYPIMSSERRPVEGVD